MKRHHHRHIVKLDHRSVVLICLLLAFSPRGTAVEFSHMAKPPVVSTARP